MNVFSWGASLAFVLAGLLGSLPAAAASPSSPPASQVRPSSAAGADYLQCNYVSGLVTAMFNEKASYSKDVHRWLILKYLQTSDFTTESQAISQGVKLNIIYEGIPIGGSDDKKFSNLMEYKRTRLQQDLDTGSTESERVKYERALDSPGASVVKEMYAACIASQSANLSCSASIIGDTILLGFNFNPPARVGAKTPFVNSGTISNARTVPTGSITTATLGKKRIDPGGTSVMLYRANPKEPVVFSISTTQGNCVVDPIPARPRYSVSVQIGGTAVEAVTLKQRVSGYHDHRNCNQMLTYNVTEVCMGDPSVKLDSVLLAEAPNNPWAEKENKASCFKATRVFRVDPSPKGINCGSAVVELQECPVVNLCAPFLIQGARRTSYTLEGQGRINRDTQLEAELSSFPSHDAGTLEVRYSKPLPENVTVKGWTWTVDVHDQSTNTSTKLSNTQTAMGGIRAQFSEATKTLLVVLP